MTTETPPFTATAGMLIRRPVDVVFQAFADPRITTRFWFTDASGPLEPGARVTWSWAAYGVSIPVRVEAFEPGHRVLIDWGDPATEVEWRFEARAEGTWVTVDNRGLADVAALADATGGFALTLAAAKIWLEQGVDPRIVPDRFPGGWTEAWKARQP